MRKEGVVLFFLVLLIGGGLVIGVIPEGVKMDTCYDTTTCKGLENNLLYRHTAGKEDYRLLTDTGEIARYKERDALINDPTPADIAADIVLNSPAATDADVTKGGDDGSKADECKDNEPKELQYRGKDGEKKRDVGSEDTDSGKSDTPPKDELTTAEIDKVKDPSKNEENKINSDDFACRMKGIMKGDNEASIDAFVEGMGNMKSEERQKVWDSGNMDKDTRNKFFEKFMKKKGIKFDNKGSDMKGKWLGAKGEPMDFTPEGFSKPIGLPGVDKWNEKSKNKDKKITDVKLKDGVLSYIFNGGRNVNLHKSGGASFDAENMAVTLNDESAITISGDNSVDVDSKGRLKLGFGLVGGELKTSKAKFQGEKIGVSMWPVEGVSVPASAKDFKSLAKDKYKYWKNGDDVYSVDKDGVVRKFQSAVVIPGKGDVSAKMVGGFSEKSGVGTFFPSSDSGGTVVDWTGEATGANTFSYDEDKKSLSINSNKKAWFTMVKNLEKLDLKGKVEVQNGNTVIKNVLKEDGKNNIVARDVLNQGGESSYAIGSVNGDFKIEKGEGNDMILKTKDGKVIYGGKDVTPEDIAISVPGGDNIPIPGVGTTTGVNGISENVKASQYKEYSSSNSVYDKAMSAAGKRETDPTKPTVEYWGFKTCPGCEQFMGFVNEYGKEFNLKYMGSDNVPSVGGRVPAFRVNGEKFSNAGFSDTVISKIRSK